MNKSNEFTEAGLCVKCGLCLPHCPTYSLTLDENESPRGRIELIQGWSKGALKVNTKLLNHLDACLLCRSCEAVCPAQVPYGRLLDRFRAKVGKAKHPLGRRLKVSIVRRMLGSKRQTRVFNTLLRFYKRSRFKLVVNKLGALRPLGIDLIDELLPTVKSSVERREIYSASGRQIGEVGLFIGCMGELVDSETVTAAINMLTQLGYRVFLPENQGCCGALDLHAGDVNKAQVLFRNNLEAFNKHQLDAIVSIASGCGAMLKEYTIYNGSSPESAEFSSNIKDISQFIVDSPGFEELSFDSLAAKIFVHLPCSLTNVMHEDQGPYHLLGKIPAVSLTFQKQGLNCCGAAGSYMLEHTHIARSVRNGLIDSILRERPDYLVTSNIGCALHIRSGLRAKGMDIEVLHPVVLAERFSKWASRLDNRIGSL